MTTYEITVTNIYEGCDAEVEQQVTVSGCTTYLVKLVPNSTALGLFNVYLDASIYYSAQTKTQMLSGVTLSVNCFDIYIITQDDEQLLSQDGLQLIIQ